ncbi:ERBB-3 BINDING PROTEIN 1 (StEBP1) [Durusdinium trenchii]|uniref:ERBB-3 BINDING PROTEIN 1 (StEBP1) n=1 Tax=Durusdinium trenchii TaxID=1381693 RepID=A0ABP0QW65_9DINO
MAAVAQEAGGVAMMEASDEEEEEEVEDLRNSDVVTKYKAASDVANKTLQGLVGYAKAGMRVLDICIFGDQLITQQCGSMFKSKTIEKGVAFPTSVSVNDCVCHNSPLASETDVYVLKEGDVVKLDLGVHIDGYIAVTAHTFVIRADPSTPITGKAADVCKAAYLAAEAAVKLITPGAGNGPITEAIKKVADDFGVTPVQGVLMHQMKRFVIDGNNVVIGREEIEQKVDPFEFEDAQVYTVDVVMSTGEGKPIERDARTTVFKRAVEQKYMLKMKASRYVFSEVDKKFPTLPFTIRALDDERQARMGVVECLKHNLLHAYPVLFEKSGDLVAHFKFTVLLLPTGTVKITGLPVNVAEFATDKEPCAEIKEILSRSSKKKKRKKKNKKAGEAAAAPAGEAPKAMETD